MSELLHLWNLLDRKHHICLLVGAWIMGELIFLQSAPYQRLITILIASLISFSLFLYFKMTKKTDDHLIQIRSFLFILFLVFCVGAGYGRTCVSDMRYAHFEAAYSEGQSIEVIGKIYKKEYRKDQMKYYIKIYSDLRQHIASGRLVFTAADRNLRIGDMILVKGVFHEFEHERNEGGFDAWDYEHSLLVGGELKTQSEIIVLNRSSLHIIDSLYGLQERLRNVYVDELGERDAGILCTMILGNKTMLDRDVRKEYQSAGISHILAISGLHISILGYSVFRFLRKCNVNYWICAGLSSALVSVFVITSGMSVSALRAVIMFIISMGSEISGRYYDFYHGAAMAAIALLLWNPFCLVQSGFLFSFTAMIGIGSFSRLIRFQRLRHYDKHVTMWKKLCGNLREGLFSGVLLQLWLIPLMAWNYYEIPVFSVFLNVIVLLLSEYLILFGILGGLTGVFFPLLSKWLLVICHFILTVYEKLIMLVEVIPYHNLITGRPKGIYILLYYMALVILLSLINAMLYQYRIWTKDLLQIHSSVIRRKICVFLVLPVLALFCLIAKPCMDKQLRVDFLDVGQGDGICIHIGEGYHIFMDGGSTTEASLGEYVLEPYLKFHGVRCVDAWIITHGDMDHISGMMEVIEQGYPVKCIYLAECMPHDEAWRQIIDLAEKNRIEVQYIETGDCIDVDEVSMQCIAPDEAEQGADRNDLSLVWKLEEGEHSLLLTGDISAAQEERLLDQGILDQTDVLKVAHHGSRYSTSQRFLEQTKPQVAIISCSEQNKYGHPHEELLNRLQAHGIRVFITKDCGQVSLSSKRDTWNVMLPCEED